jgi:rhodanese-related sulfurtransferase
MQKLRYLNHMESNKNATTTDQTVMQGAGQTLDNSDSPTPESDARTAVAEAIEETKNVAKDAIPNTPVTSTQFSIDPVVVKDRLDKGEPALTIVDIRDRRQFNEERITGAVSMPMAELVEQATASLSPVRDIYVYGESDVSTAEAAKQLRQAGFRNVAEIKGNLGAWKAIDAPVEGIVA